MAPSDVVLLAVEQDNLQQEICHFAKKAVEADLHMISLCAQMINAEILVHSCCVKEINTALILLASVNLVVFIFTKLNRPVEGGGRNKLSSMVLW